MLIGLAVLSSFNPIAPAMSLHIYRYENKTFVQGQSFDVYVDRVDRSQGRLVVSLTPVYRRNDVREDGSVLPVYNLKDLKIGE